MVNKILLATLIALLVGIAGITAVHFAPRSATAASTAPAATEKTFRGIGRIRATLADTAAATVVVEPCFPYDSADRAFAEELAAHVQDFRNATRAYFKTISTKSPTLDNTDAVKQALLARYNDFLLLGRIKTLYFVDFIVVK
jgi:flagellar basal body-associated protein FliL